VGGLTENQLIQLSDAIAEKFDNAALSAKERGYCIKTIQGEQRLLLYVLDNIGHGELTSPHSKLAVKQLLQEIDHMIPPRAVFKGLFEDGGTGSQWKRRFRQ